MLDLVTVLPVQTSDEAEKFRAGELLIDEWPVGDEPQLRFRRQWVGAQVDAREMDGPGRWLENPGDHAKRCRLSRAIGTEKSEQLAIRDTQINGVNGREGAVFLGQTF